MKRFSSEVQGELFFIWMIQGSNFRTTDSIDLHFDIVCLANGYWLLFSGKNSYDMFSWIISEQDLLHNVENASQNLLQYGYQVGFFLFSKLFSYFP